MENRIKLICEKKNKIFNEAFDKKQAQYLACADEDRFAPAKPFGKVKTPRGNGLWREIKAKGSLLLSLRK